jgi:flagellar hook-associated protein 3 FlgL
MGVGLDSIQKHSTEVMNYQQQISSGSKYQLASDSGLAAGLSVQVVLDQSQYSMYKVNQDYLTASYSSAQTQISSINDMLVRSQQLMVQAGNDAIGRSGRLAIQQELMSLRDSIYQAATAKDANGQPILKKDPPYQIDVAGNVTLASGIAFTDVMGSSFSDAAPDYSQPPVPINPTTQKPQVLDVLTSVINQLGSGVAPTSNQIQYMSDALTQVNTANVSVGVLQNRLDAATQMANTQKTNVDKQRSNLLDTDLAAASAGLMKSNALLSAAQSVMAKMDVNSLFSKL